MDLFEVIRSRRSVRKFRDMDVGSKDIERVLEAGRWAPSAGNLESRDYIVVREEKGRMALANSAGQNFVAEAPVVVVVCANMEQSSQRYGERGYNLYSIQDASAAIQNMLLMAHHLGLAGCWVGAFDEEVVREELGVPEGVRPVALIPFGYPAEEPEPPKRSALSDFVHKEDW